jgi:hypothetical protein
MAESKAWVNLFQQFHDLIVRDYGVRCAEPEGGCPICQMWGMYDLLKISVCLDIPPMKLPHEE